MNEIKTRNIFFVVPPLYFVGVSVVVLLNTTRLLERLEGALKIIKKQSTSMLYPALSFGTINILVLQFLRRHSFF